MFQLKMFALLLLLKVAWSGGAFASPGSATGSAWAPLAPLKSSDAMQLAESKDMLFFLDAYTGTSNLGSQEGMNMNMLFFLDRPSGTANLVSLDGSMPNCQLPGYPATYNYASTLNYVPAIGQLWACGGYNMADANKCWAFDGSSWTPLPDSGQQHCWFFTPNTLVPERGWWITGRAQVADIACREELTSEVYSTAGWATGPTLPFDFSDMYCVVQLNTSHSLVAGGDPSWSETWLYNWDTELWTQSGSLNAGRYRHACIVLEGGQGVLMVGGLDEDYEPTYVVELYDPTTGSWAEQPSLSEDIIGDRPTLLNWQGAVIGVFEGDQVFRRGDNGDWTPLEGVRLPEMFEGYKNDKAVLVPDAFAAGCM